MSWMKKNGRTGVMTALMAVLLLMGCMPTAVYASEQTALEMESIVVDADNDLTADECFSAYVDRAFGLYADVDFYGNYGDRYFEQGTSERQIYDSLKSAIERVAMNGGSTEFTIDLKNCPISGASADTQSEAKNNAEIKLVAQVRNVLNALLVDCPLDLYWYKKGGSDKPVGCSYLYQSKTTEENEKYVMSCVSLSIKFAVADAYREKEASDPEYTVTSDV